MSRIALAALAVSLAATTAAQAAASAGKRAFYLTARPGMCLIATSKAGGTGHKYLTHVPCTNPKHNFEVFSIQHGGWGKTPVPANAPTRVLQICRAAYNRVTGHPLRAPGGVSGFWPDPGTEQARYGDKVICSYILYPSYGPLGSGRHIP